jgi:hypothetical protein
MLMLVIRIVKGDCMFNWYSEYLLIRARQREVERAAQSRQRLAEGRDSLRPRRKPERPRSGAAFAMPGSAAQFPSACC